MMNIKRRKLLKSSLMIGALTSLMSLVSIAHARSLKQLRILVGFPAGGGSDHVARILSESFNQQNGFSSYVENKSGAGGLIAAQSLLQPIPGIESTLLSHDHTISILPLFPQSGNTQFIAQLQPIAGIATFANAFAVSAKVPAKTFPEYLDWLKNQNTLRLAVGVPAPNSIPEYFVKIISRHFALDLNPVAYRGSAPMLTDILGNQISACIASVPELLEYQRAGFVRVLGVMGGHRQVAISEAPTFSELGLIGFEQLPYYGFFGAPNISKESIASIDRVVESVLTDSSTREKLASIGLDVKYRSTEQFKAQVQSYSQLWKRLIN